MMSRRCVVVGRATNPRGDGGVRVVFKPERGGTLSSGEMVTSAATQTYSGPDGALRVELAPSSVVGPYTVRMAGHEFQIVVPDSPAARLSDITVKRSPPEEPQP